MKIAAFVFSLLIATSPAIAQSDLDRAAEAPLNPYAAQSPWGQFHRNAYAQASTPLRGLEPGEQIEVQYLPLPRWGGTPTQMHISERYPDGSRTVWSTTLTSLVKARVKGDQFTFAAGYRFERSLLNFNIHWNMQLGRGNKAFVPDPNNRAILRMGERNPSDPMSEIVLEDRFVLPEQIQGKPTVLNLSFDGWVIFVTSEAWVGAVKTDFSAWRAFNLGAASNDVTVHNSFPLDEAGNLYVVSFFAMSKVQWTGDGFELVWRTPYNFRGEGCPPPSENNRREVLRVLRGEACTGSGTTPTLVGRDSMDKLVVAVDGHRNNNLVAFWRDEIPADWQGLPGYDRRVAAVLPLPYSTSAGDGFTAENSPPVAGYDIAVAQFAGFRPRCQPPQGVQMARWDPAENRLRLLWSNPNVQFNNVMTISWGSNLVYGVGRGERCNYVYRGLDRQSGRIAFSVPLGRSGNFLDQGNSHALNDDRSIIFGTSNGMVRMRPVGEIRSSGESGFLVFGRMILHNAMNMIRKGTVNGIAPETPQS
jgi:hypothetical protein